MSQRFPLIVADAFTEGRKVFVTCEIVGIRTEGSEIGCSELGVRVSVQHVATLRTPCGRVFDASPDHLAIARPE